MAGSLGSLGRSWSPAPRLPTQRGILHEIAGDDCHDEKRDTEVSKCWKNAHTLDEVCRHRRRHQCSRSESAHRNASDEASAAREPFDQYCDRHNVTQTGSGTTDYPVSEVQPP